MALPSASDFNKYDGTKFNNTDWDQNVDKTVEILAAGNYDLNVNQITAQTYANIPSEKFSTLTAGEDLDAGDVVRISGGQLLKADNTTEAGITDVVGINVQTVTSGNTAEIAYGFYDDFSSLTVGTTYYVGVDGGITSTESTYQVRLGVAVSTTRINLDIATEKLESLIIDRKIYWATQTGFNSDVTWVDVTPERISDSNAIIWPTEKLSNGEHIAILRIEINGGGVGGDGFDLRIIDDNGLTVYQSNSQIINNPGATEILNYNFRLATGNVTNLNLGTKRLYGITQPNSTADSRWTIQAKRSAGSSTSGTFNIRSVEFLLVEV